MLLTIFQEVPDHRRGQARQYNLEYVLLFSVLAIMSEADSYRRIHSWIKLHFKFLKRKFRLQWKQVPAYTTIRNIIQGVNSEELEKAFRKYSKEIANIDEGKYKFLSLDGKVVRGSFDHFQDQKAIQVFSVFLTNTDIILAHEEIKNCKTNEIPVAQQIIEKLGLAKCVFTLDALHCQKKLLKL